jgi:hypothetical protein
VDLRTNHKLTALHPSVTSPMHMSTFCFMAKIQDW